MELYVGHVDIESTAGMKEVGRSVLIDYLVLVMHPCFNLDAITIWKDDAEMLPVVYAAPHIIFKIILL